MTRRYVLLERRLARPDDAVWYEIIRVERAFPMAVETRHCVAVAHTEATGNAIVDELNSQYRDGVIAGMTRFAWWADGRQMVGTCGTTLEQAVKDFLSE